MFKEHVFVPASSFKDVCTRICAYFQRMTLICPKNMMKTQRKRSKSGKGSFVINETELPSISAWPWVRSDCMHKIRLFHYTKVESAVYFMPTQRFAITTYHLIIAMRLDFSVHPSSFPRFTLTRLPFNNAQNNKLNQHRMQIWLAAAKKRADVARPRDDSNFVWLSIFPLSLWFSEFCRRACFGTNNPRCFN